MPKFSTMEELINDKSLGSQDEFTLPGGSKTTVEKFALHAEILNKLMSTKAHRENVPFIHMMEALTTADASILFPKVISDVLLRPLQPVMIGQTLLSRTIQVDNVKSIEFPTLGAMRAFDMSETQEYHEQGLNMTEHIAEIKVNKVGLMLAISEEVVRDSMWDVLALYLEQAGYAMIRHKEKKIFDEYSNHGQVIFDNTLSTSDAWTRGKNAAQVLNGSLSFIDLLDTMAALIANEYNPTDIIMHPMAWTIFAKDPVLRFQLVHHGPVGQFFGNIGIDQAAVQSNMPFGIQTQLTPFAPFSTQTTLATGPFASGGTYDPSGNSGADRISMVTDITVIDRAQGVLVLQRDEMSSEDFSDPRRDIMNIKMRERYGVGILNGGRSVANIKNVRLVDNKETVFNVGNVTPT
jgi:hypothetical protein